MSRTLFYFALFLQREVKPTRVATLRDYLSRWFGPDSARPAGQGDAIAAVIADAGPENVGSIAFVPVDLSQLTQIWGSESTVKSLLDAFVSAVRDDLRALPPLLNELDVPALRQWHHRVAGAVGVLQYPPLLGALEQYRRQLTSTPSETLRSEGIALVRTCNTMLDGIEEQAALLAWHPAPSPASQRFAPLRVRHAQRSELH